ncbi:MAG: hypothetical protein ACW981_11105 [Candidatus Hodarchaeales archaeon]
MLMCPYCGEEPPIPKLQLHSLKSSQIKHGTRIHYGTIYCEGCTRFWMIQDEILYMSTDNIRNKDKELDFLKEWQKSLPDYIIEQAKPHNLKNK